jgi:hypothetical protein
MFNKLILALATALMCSLNLTLANETELKEIIIETSPVKASPKFESITKLLAYDQMKACKTQRCVVQSATKSLFGKSYSKQETSSILKSGLDDDNDIIIPTNLLDSGFAVCTGVAGLACIPICGSICSTVGSVVENECRKDIDWNGSSDSINAAVFQCKLVAMAARAGCGIGCLDSF